MAKSIQMLRAQKLRRKGKSIKEIAKAVGVSKSSASAWCSAILLSSEQKEILRKKMIEGNLAGRLKGAHIQRDKKLTKIANYKELAYSRLKHLQDEEILALGIGLYLGEGGKTGSRFRFSNSNPNIIRFVIFWLGKFFHVKKERITLRVLINESHESREKEVARRWAEITHIPINQFRRTTFVKSKNKKIFENFSHRLGTIALSVLKSSDLQYEVLGLCHAFLSHTIGKLTRGTDDRMF